MAMLSIVGLTGCATTDARRDRHEVSASEHRHTPWRYRWRGKRTAYPKRADHQPAIASEHDVPAGTGAQDETE
jgi:hypothetical protein